MKGECSVYEEELSEDKGIELLPGYREGPILYRRFANQEMDSVYEDRIKPVSR